MPRVFRSDNNGNTWSPIFARGIDKTVGLPQNVQPGWLDYTSFAYGFAAPFLDVAVANSNADEALVADRFGPSLTTDGGDAGGCARLIGAILGAEIDDWAERWTMQDGVDGSGRRVWTSIGIEPTHTTALAQAEPVTVHAAAGPTRTTGESSLLRIFLD